MKLTDRIDIGGGVAVSPAALGAMNFGTTTSREDAFAVLDAYVGAGGNFIDTSNNYAHWAGTGDESETLLGEWLESRGCRDDVVIATKVGFDRHGTGAGLRREQIEYWAGESLRKLRTDRIDVYYAHTDDTSTPLGETAEAFASLVREGKVRLLGCSNFDLSGVISPLISSRTLGTYQPGEFPFQYPIILPFHTVHGVLKARILKWFAIPFSSGPHSVISHFEQYEKAK